MERLLVVALLAIFAVCLLFKTYLAEEKFESKREKAVTITEWFRKNADHSYENFRRATGGKSNIVEYEDALKLHKAGTLTPDIIERML